MFPGYPRKKTIKEKTAAVMVAAKAMARSTSTENSRLAALRWSAGMGLLNRRTPGTTWVLVALLVSSAITSDAGLASPQ
jgi:hypothetical protein